MGRERYSKNKKFLQLYRLCRIPYTRHNIQNTKWTSAKYNPDTSHVTGMVRTSWYADWNVVGGDGYFQAVATWRCTVCGLQRFSIQHLFVAHMFNRGHLQIKDNQLNGAKRRRMGWVENYIIFQFLNNIQKISPLPIIGLKPISYDRAHTSALFPLALNSTENDAKNSDGTVFASSYCQRCYLANLFLLCTWASILYHVLSATHPSAGISLIQPSL